MEGYQEVNEIDLIDLMFYCLKRWRWIIVCMVLFGILAGVYQYQATIEDNQVKREEQIKQATAETVEGEGKPAVFGRGFQIPKPLRVAGTAGCLL